MTVCIARGSAENTLLEANGFDRPEADPVCYYSPGLDVVTARSKRWERSGGLSSRLAAIRAWFEAELN